MDGTLPIETANHGSGFNFDTFKLCAKQSWDKAQDRNNWVDENIDNEDCAAVRKVPELLAEQIEAANIILINKKDLAGADQVKIASSLARELNQNAEIVHVEYGRVDPDTIIRPKQPIIETSASNLQTTVIVAEHESGGVDDIDEMSLEELKDLMLTRRIPTRGCIPSGSP